MSYRPRRDADYLPRHPECFELLEAEREEARRLHDEAQARAFDAHLDPAREAARDLLAELQGRAAAEEAFEPLPPDRWPSVLLALAVGALALAHALELARAGWPLAALGVVLAGAGVAVWLYRVDLVPRDER